jgi:hypothetical protein
LGLVLFAIYLLYLASAKPWKMGLVQADGSAFVEVWFDSNGNGRKDVNESPLAGVCVWDQPWLHVPDEKEVTEICGSLCYQTDDSGKWEGDFHAGQACDDFYVFAKPPEGYRPSTPPVVNYCVAEFGFVLEDSALQDAYPSYAAYARRWQAARVLGRVGVVAAVAVVAVGISIGLVRPKKFAAASIEERPSRASFSSTGSLR